nr:hypothetical protein [Tanacetum cinerariifolium]
MLRAMTHVKSNTNVLGGAFIKAMLKVEKERVQLDKTFSSLLKYSDLFSFYNGRLTTSFLDSLSQHQLGKKFRLIGLQMLKVILSMPLVMERSQRCACCDLRAWKKSYAKREDRGRNTGGSTTTSQLVMPCCEQPILPMNVKRFTFFELQNATWDFHKDGILGEGGLVDDYCS